MDPSETEQLSRTVGSIIKAQQYRVVVAIPVHYGSNVIESIVSARMSRLLLSRRASFAATCCCCCGSYLLQLYLFACLSNTRANFLLKYLNNSPKRIESVRSSRVGGHIHKQKCICNCIQLEASLTVSDMRCGFGLSFANSVSNANEPVDSLLSMQQKQQPARQLPVQSSKRENPFAVHQNSAVVVFFETSYFRAAALNSVLCFCIRFSHANSLDANE